MWLWICVFYLSVTKLQTRVTDAEYALMPPVYHYDDYTRCMLLGKEAIYCTVIIELSPVNPKNTSKLWKVIEEESRPSTNFKHYKLRHGVCLWQSCGYLFQSYDQVNEKSLKSGISDCYSDKFASDGMKANVTEVAIHHSRIEGELEISKIVLMVFIAVIGILVGYGTIFEGIKYASRKMVDKNPQQSSFSKVMSCFSLQKNWTQLLSTYTSENATAMRSIQGVRFITMFSIICTHSMYSSFMTGIYNTRDVELGYPGIKSMTILNNTYACQAFLVISACLLSHQYFLIFEKEKEVKPQYLLISFINRYIRLTPSLVALIILASCSSHINEPGPSSIKISRVVNTCPKNWWINMLYINNYYDVMKMCGPHTWYLAVDVQLYLVSLIILGIIWRFQKHTCSILGFCLTIAIVIPIAVNYINDYNIVGLHTEEVAGYILEIDFFRSTYIPTHANMGACVIGLIFGYILFKTRNRKVFTKKIHILLWYILVFFPPLIVVYLGVFFYAEDYVNNRIVAALYTGIARNAVAFSVALGIFGVSQGIGSFLRDFLNWAPLHVLGKLCYCSYLFHVGVLMHRGSPQRFPSVLHTSLVVWQFLGDVTVSFLLSLVVCLCYEMPLLALQKLYMPQINGTKKHTE